MPSLNFVRWGALAMILGGLLFVVFGLVHFVFTHGSTGVDRHCTLFGLDGTDYCRMQVTWPALLLVGLVALRSGYSGSLGRLGRAGIVTSVVALGMQIASIAMQCWLKDPHVAADFESVTLTLGFYLGALSYLILAVGMVMLGIGAIRAGAWGWERFLPLVIGLLVMPTVLFNMSGAAGGGLGWDLVYAASRFPLGLSWILLGITLLGITLASNRGKSSSG